ncbi:hypothetical protein DMUE_2055 [Dictyocoela muelleri]|nr:hypothetical protein DMUE_2055 [Dictyocoela muelleri]
MPKQIPPNAPYKKTTALLNKLKDIKEWIPELEMVNLSKFLVEVKNSISENKPKTKNDILNICRIVKYLENIYGISLDFLEKRTDPLFFVFIFLNPEKVIEKLKVYFDNNNDDDIKIKFICDFLTFFPDFNDYHDNNDQNNEVNNNNETLNNNENSNNMNLKEEINSHELDLRYLYNDSLKNSILKIFKNFLQKIKEKNKIPQEIVTKLSIEMNYNFIEIIKKEKEEFDFYNQVTINTKNNNFKFSAFNKNPLKYMKKNLNENNIDIISGLVKKKEIIDKYFELTHNYKMVGRFYKNLNLESNDILINCELVKYGKYPESQIMKQMMSMIERNDSNVSNVLDSVGRFLLLSKQSNEEMRRIIEKVKKMNITGQDRLRIFNSVRRVLTGSSFTLDHTKFFSFIFQQIDFTDKMNSKDSSKNIQKSRYKGKNKNSKNENKNLTNENMDNSKKKPDNFKFTPSDEFVTLIEKNKGFIFLYCLKPWAYESYEKLSEFIIFFKMKESISKLLRIIIRICYLTDERQKSICYSKLYGYICSLDDIPEFFKIMEIENTKTEINSELSFDIPPNKIINKPKALDDMPYNELKTKKTPKNFTTIPCCTRLSCCIEFLSRFNNRIPMKYITMLMNFVDSLWCDNCNTIFYNFCILNRIDWIGCFDKELEKLQLGC